MSHITLEILCKDEPGSLVRVVALAERWNARVVRVEMDPHPLGIRSVLELAAPPSVTTRLVNKLAALVNVSSVEPLGRRTRRE